MLQLKPGFDHINEADKRKHERAKNADYEDRAVESKPVNIIYKRIETPRAQAARMRSHTHMQQQSDAEPWSTLE